MAKSTPSEHDRPVVIQEKRTVSLVIPRQEPKKLRYLAPVLIWCIIVCFISARMHRALPTPSRSDIDINTGLPIFNENRAMKIIRKLSDAEHFGYRIVGTKELLDSQEYLYDLLKTMKADLEGSELSKIHDMEIYWQKGDSAHLFDFMDKVRLFQIGTSG